ncbi:MAG: Tat proofreading chaperone DmsD [Coriobacteriia bacterium]|nr:Tat proofreading chaperone DmsD [Coriobacteriia bacterium]
MYEKIAVCGQALGALFIQNPRDAEAFTPLVDALNQFESFDDWPFGKQTELAQAYELVSTGALAPLDELAREYQRLFIGPHHFEAPAWGSVYLDREQVVFGSSLLELREWMREHSILTNEKHNVPEDHIGKMLALLGWLAAEKPELVDQFLAYHLMPWAPRYLSLLHECSKHTFYTGLALWTQATLSSMVQEYAIAVAKRKLYR